MFPFYLVAKRLGGQLREKPLSWENLTLDDVERALMDVRENSDRILRDIAEDIEYNMDVRRDLTRTWVEDARIYVNERQQSLVKALEEKVASADPNADNKMFQSKAEAEKELEMAKTVHEGMPAGKVDNRKLIWNPLNYEEYH
jgi:sulfate adenylyltransferase